MEETIKTWLVEDTFFFPENFLGLRKPDGGFFMALENQSTDDGKVFVNPLQDQDFINYALTVIRAYELPQLLAKSKTFVRSKKFKQDAIYDESEHGVVYWNIDEDKVAAMAFSTQGSDLLMDEASTWLGEAQCVGSLPIHGLGTIPNTNDKLIQTLMTSLPPPLSPARSEAFQAKASKGNAAKSTKLKN